MANYLERLVAAGARAVPLARPRGSAPPLLPVTSLPIPAFGSATVPSFTEPAARRVGAELPFLGTETPHHDSDLSETVGGSPDPTAAGFPPKPTIDARSPSSPMEETASVLLPRIEQPAASVKPAEPEVVETSKRPASQERSTDALAPGHAKPALPAFPSWNAPIRVEAPRGLRPIPRRAETPKPPSPVASGPSAGMDPPTALKPVAEPASAHAVETDKALLSSHSTSDAVLIEPRESRAPLPSRGQEQPALKVAAPVISAPRQAVPPKSMPAAKKQGRISIGSIEVRVNNQTAPAKSAAPRPSPPVHSDPFETRYLNRFSLKP